MDSLLDMANHDYAVYLEHGIEMKGEKQGVVICPGPNLAYFDSEVPLSKMIQHIYGNNNILSPSYRPNMFVNELKMYVDYFKKHTLKLSETNLSEQKKWNNFNKTYWMELLIMIRCLKIHHFSDHKLRRSPLNFKNINYCYWNKQQ